MPNLYQSSWEKLSEKNWNNHIWPFQILYQSFWEKLSEKDWNNHIWPFQTYTSPFGKHCPKKIGTSNFGHSKFIPVLLGNIVGKRLEQTFLAIPNLYQSFWEKLLEKIWNNHFWPFQIYTSLFGKNCQKKLGMATFWLCLIYTSLLGKNCQKKIGTTIFGHSKFYTSPFGKNYQKKIGTTIFGHSKFIPVLLGNIVQKKLEHPILAIPNLYQSFWETLLEKDWNKHFWPFLIYTSLSGKNCWKKFETTIFGHSKFIPVLLGNIVGKNSEQPFLAIPNLYQSFWETLSEKDWNKHFWPFLIYTSLSGKNCWKKFGTTIFGHSKFIPVFLGKIVGKNSEWPFLAIPNLYQSS